MSIGIWSKEQASKVYSNLSPVLKNSSDVTVQAASDFSMPESCKVVFALGGDSLEFLRGQGIIPKNRTIGSLRGVQFDYKGVPVLISYSSDIKDIDHGLYTDLLTDMSMAIRLHKTGSLLPKYGEYRYVEDFSEAIAGIKAQFAQTGQIVNVALDLETRGLDPFCEPTLKVPGGYIITIQVAWEKGKCDLVRFGCREQEEHALSLSKLKDQMQWLLNDPSISLRGANLKYDLVWLYVRGHGLESTNFKFDTTLVGCLLDENRSNGLDVHTKIYLPELGGYCVAPWTRLWKADLTWATAGSLEVGDTLVGFEEHPVPGQRRKLQKSVVLSKQVLKLPGRKVTMKSGKVLTVSCNHAWLGQNLGSKGNLQWLRTDKMKPGYRIKTVAEVLEPKKDFDSGWFSGILDGEGSTSQAAGLNTFRLQFAQKDGLVLQKALKVLGTDVCVHASPGKSCYNIAMRGSFSSLSALQLYRPVRLLSKEHWWGAALPQEPEWDEVISVENCGVIEVVSLKTSTATFVAEGLASHNSDEFDRTVDKNRMDLVPPEKLLPYAGGDGHATLGVAEVLKKELLADPKLTAFYVNILHPASRALEKVERGGVCVDLNEYKTLAADLDVEIGSIIAKAKSILGGLLVAKHTDSTKFGGINLTKASLLADFMFSPKGLNLKPKMFTPKPDKHGEKKPSTSMEHLLMFAEDKNAAPFVALLDDYSSATKVRGTYVGEVRQSGFLEYLRSDGRFHPTYWMFAGDKNDDEGGTVTGRLSCKDPAFQTIPKHHKWAKRIRKCFVAPDGYLVMERDYSQGELRVIACIANESNMIKTYQEGKDLHTRTGGGVAGYSYEQMLALEVTDHDLFEAVRQKGKAGNFGMVFGMQAPGFVVYARRNYGVIMELEEAEKFRNGFFEEYPALLTYHKEYKAFAHKHGYVRGPLGRIRHLPLIKSPMREYRSKAERQAINSPVQGTLSDMLIWSMALEDAAGLTKECPAFAIVHDAAYSYVPEAQADEFAKKHLDIQQNLPFERVGWKPQLTFPADAKLGPNMADLKKLKVA